MLNFLCGLTANQWKIVHTHPPTGTVEDRPEGYKLAGLYEGKAVLWLIQSTHDHHYRYWNYSDVFQTHISKQEMDEMVEVIVKMQDQAQSLRHAAEQLVDEADRLDLVIADIFRAALIGTDMES